MKCLQVAAALAAIALSTHTGSAWSADVWHTSTIRWVYPQADGSFVLAFDVDSASCPNIGVPKYHTVAVNQNGVTEEGAKKIYAAALLALASDKQVQLNFSDLTTSCYINRLLVVK